MVGNWDMSTLNLSPKKTNIKLKIKFKEFTTNLIDSLFLIGTSIFKDTLDKLSRNNSKFAMYYVNFAL